LLCRFHLHGRHAGPRHHGHLHRRRALQTGQPGFPVASLNFLQTGVALLAAEPLAAGPRNAESHRNITARDTVDIAEGTAQEIRTAVERAAARHTTLAVYYVVSLGRPTLFLFHGFHGRFHEPVLAPLQRVAVHVKKPKIIGLLLAYRARS